MTLGSLQIPTTSASSFTILPTAPRTSLLAAVLKGEVAVSAIASDGTLKYATSVQIAGVLDDLFFFPGKLGVIFPNSEDEDSRDANTNTCDGNGILLSVWAPTAQSVNLQLFEHAADIAPAKVPAMHENNGLWSPCVAYTLHNKYYL